MRIAVVTPYAVGGGVTEAFFTALEILRRAGAAPVAVVDAAAGFLPRLAGVETVPVKGLGAGGDLNIWLAGRRLSKALRRARVDRVLVHNGRYIKAARVGVPVVGVMHGGKARRFLAADRLITVNEDQRRDLIACGYKEQDIRLIPNALPLDTIPSFVPRVPGKPFRIGTLRLLLHEKGVDVLVAAVGLLVAKGRALELHVGGTGAEEEALRRQVAGLGLGDLVHFHGWVDDQAGFLSGLDLYVMPSRYETFGIGILEAQAASLPVIASACEGPRAVIRDGETGILVPAGDAPALAAAIEGLMDDGGRAGRLARAGHADCAARHLLPAIAGPYAEWVMEAGRG